MKKNGILKTARDLANEFRITDGKKFRLKQIDPGDTLRFGSEDKPRAKKLLAEGVEALAKLQNVLYAQNRWGVLLIFQAMDAGGKDSAIKHVMSGVNPQGCQVYSFKAPSTEELDHDYLWRCVRCLPRRGNIGIFNRSYYEETLAVRVHPQFLEKQKLPPELVTKSLWKDRFRDIRNLESYLARNGFAVCKFFLHVSKKEQKKRFLERLDNPEKNWKFESADLVEREFWDQYQAAYESTIQHTATKAAPWYVVPADNKWFTRVVVVSAIIDTLLRLKLEYPKVAASQMRELAEAKRALTRE